MSTEPSPPVYSIVTTCYNEEANIENLVANLLNCFNEHCPGEDFELVVVLNGPTDNTPALAHELAAKHPQLRLVELAQNQGYGGGIRAGLAAAKGQFIGYIDGDEQILAPDVARVFKAARASSADIVKVVRIIREDGLQRRVLTRVYNTLFKAMFGFICHDVNGKPKVLKPEALRKLSLSSSDWFIDAELMLSAHKNGMTVEEVPVTFHKRPGGASNVRLSTIFEFLRNMYNYRTGR
ncbi:MAG: glycosyltransferase family 2 protein [Cyanobacteria bacterium SZAS LIN-3]|nr:glycosyltransferase family 2 protein [Cyanobacteria bacterium SZAS LIN-3]